MKVAFGAHWSGYCVVIATSCYSNTICWEGHICVQFKLARHRKGVIKLEMSAEFELRLDWMGWVFSPHELRRLRDDSMEKLDKMGIHTKSRVHSLRREV